MTSDEQNPLGDDVLRALRERARGQAPPAARARVSARLSRAGVGVLTTAASAAAASSLKATGVGALTAVALSKTFALGLALGVGTAVTTYVVSSDRGTPDAQVAASHAVATQAVAVIPEPAPVLAAREAEPVEAEAQLSATPELPGSARASESVRASAASTHGLAEQQGVLDGARQLLRTGDANGALAAVQQHRARFPRTAFEEERQALAIRALMALGRSAEARTQTDAFALRFPNSLAFRALREASSATPAHEIVTEPNAPPQTPSEGSAPR